MKNTNKVLVLNVMALITLMAFFACSIMSCFGSSGGGKAINSAEALKQYLDSMPANSPDKPIKVAMKVNDTMIKNIGTIIKNAGKYVILNLSGSPLKTIPDFAFVDMVKEEGCATLVGIIIPEGVTIIGKLAFIECTNLTSIIIPDSVTSIENSAFYDCTSLASVTIGKGVTIIEDGAFYNCNSLTSVIIPNSITAIGDKAFYYCTNLISVTFQSTIPSSSFDWGWVFPGDLREKFYATDKDNGTPGTYTRASSSDIWTKQ